MPDSPRGAGVVFYDRRTRRVLLVRRDNTPTIPFPGYLNILGGHTEEGEAPEDTVVREIAALRAGTVSASRTRLECREASTIAGAPPMGAIRAI